MTPFCYQLARGFKKGSNAMSRSRYISPAEIEFNERLIALFKGGASISDIGDILNCQSTIICRVLRANGLIGS